MCYNNFVENPYFAYGSNLHPGRIKHRVGAARLVGAGLLSGYEPRFHKRGRDGSGKCNALYTGASDNVVHGAIYDLSPDQVLFMDRFEGMGYKRKGAEILMYEGATISAFTYFAAPNFINDELKPFDWYLALVLAGAEFTNLPEDYIDKLADREAVVDPDPNRAEANLKSLDMIIP